MITAGVSLKAFQARREARQMVSVTVRPGGEKMQGQVVPLAEESLVNSSGQPIFIFGVHAPDDAVVRQVV